MERKTGAGETDLGEHVVAFLRQTGRGSLPICNKALVLALRLPNNVLHPKIRLR